MIGEKTKDWIKICIRQTYLLKNKNVEKAIIVFINKY